VSESEQPSEAAKRVQRTKQRYAEYVWLAKDEGGAYLETTSTTVARRKLYTRLLADLKILMDRRATLVINSVVLGYTVPNKELVRAVSTATQEIQSFFDTVTKAFEDMKEDAKKYVTYGHPSYTGEYDKDTKPIPFNKFLELRQDPSYARVGLTKLRTPKGETITVSTVWVGVDYSGVQGAPPLIFESLIMGGKGEGRMDRYTTLQQAQEGHSNLLQWVREMDGAT
jgi:hypothetical protein